MSRTWREILQDMVRQSGLWAAVLTDFQGLPFAHAIAEDWLAERDHDRQFLVDILAAFAPPLLRTGGQLERYVGDFQMDEISVRTVHGARIVSRMFTWQDMPLILTVLVPPRRAYRRVMNRTIRQLRSLNGGALP
ncbi:MAG: hypothetical protein GXO36_05515 [Chloroflexi bacterium]|nr:hypothetical protein [Chloroflexota bacterium]